MCDECNVGYLELKRICFRVLSCFKAIKTWKNGNSYETLEEWSDEDLAYALEDIDLTLKTVDDLFALLSDISAEINERSHLNKRLNVENKGIKKNG